jgi:hypothetical protein
MGNPREARDPNPLRGKAATSASTSAPSTNAANLSLWPTISPWPVGLTPRGDVSGSQSRIQTEARHGPWLEGMAASTGLLPKTVDNMLHGMVQSGTVPRKGEHNNNPRLRSDHRHGVPTPVRRCPPAKNIRPTPPTTCETCVPNFSPRTKSFAKTRPTSDSETPMIDDDTNLIDHNHSPGDACDWHTEASQ